MGDSFVIALDFGTAYSGYAFSVTDSKAESDPRLKRWGKELGLDTPKTPTCILFDKNKEFLSFGYEAKMAYINMTGEDSKKHFFFEDFKMALYGKEASRGLKIKAANGKSMRALKVFAESLRFLKDDALKTISSNASGCLFNASDFSWVLTVPALWDHSAKQFMREAATQAGIVSEGTEDNLLIALEPEAASLWCKKLPADGFITTNHDGNTLDQSPGTQYIVLDCGGGTIDITVHEVLEGGALMELHKASGNDLGGQTVDRRFKEFLKEIFSDEIWDEYEENYPSGVQRIMYEFTRLKQVDNEVQIVCPHTLIKMIEEKENMENFFDSVNGASWDGEYLRISRETLRSLFDESLRGITQNIKEILDKGFTIEYLLLVGGYAESQILCQHMFDQFGDCCKVLRPFRAQEAILKGAVEFGRNPEVLASRKSSFTYGFAVCKEFNKSIHKEEKKFTGNGKEWSRDIFRKLVEEGEDLRSDETREFICSPATANQTKLKLRFYSSVRKHPVYIDEWGAHKIGSFNIDFPDTAGEKERKVKLIIKFGSTEITATGTSMVTGEEKTVRIDFMTTDKECVIDDDNDTDGGSNESSTI